MPKVLKRLNSDEFKKAFLKLIRHIVPEKSILNFLKEKSDYDDGRIIQQDGNVFIIKSEGMKFYSKIINQFLLVEYFQRHYTEPQLKLELNRLIINYINDPNQNKKRTLINKFENELKDKNQNWEIVFPLEGIELKGIRQLKIGNCTLRPYTEYQAKKLSYNSKEWKLNVKKNIASSREYLNNKRITNIGLSNVNAYVKVKAAETMAARIGLLRLEEYLNILRLYSVWLTNDSSIAIGLKGVRSEYNHIFYSENIESEKKHATQLRIAHPVGILINKQIVKELKAKKLNDINNIYQKEFYDLNQFERRLRNSINSFGKGVGELNLIEKFLAFMISIESLIAPKRGALTEHFALVMSKLYIKSAHSLEYRKEIYDRFRELYSVRSRLVHGRGDYINEIFVKEAQKYSIELIFYMLSLKNEFEKDEQLSEWFKELKLK